MDNSTRFSATCKKCGKTIYEGEMLNIKGSYVCENCADECIFDKPCRSKRRRTPSPFFHFIFSLHPGAGHMYLGLMKKGLFQMCLFYLCIYLTSFFEAAGLVIPIICIYSFFDSLSLRRRLVNGEILNDDLYNEKLFFNKNMGLIAIVVIIMLVGGMFSSLMNAVVINKKMPEAPTPPPRIERYIPIPENGNAMTYSVTIGKSHYLINMAKPILLTGLGALVLYNVAKRHKRKNSDE